MSLPIMSTKIDDLDDPYRDSELPKNIHLKNPNTSNISLDIIKPDLSINNFFCEKNLIILFIIILSCLPESKTIISNIIPTNYNNNIVIIIAQIISIYIIYIILSNIFS